MDIADIEKVANRKRINAEAEKLREKVNKEITNMIKHMVAQDTPNWDSIEKLHQLKNNRERLHQQNMVEVQIQHEAISGQYQDELKLRSETLNKSLNSTREICDVLEEHSERLNATVSRCLNNQAMLAEAYKFGEIVKEIKEKQSQSEQKILLIINNLQEVFKLLSEYNEKMAQVFNISKQHLDSELNDARPKLATSLSQEDELFELLNDMSRKLDYNNRELEKIIEQSLVEQQNLKDQLFALEQHKSEIVSELNNATQKLELRSVKIEEMSLLIQELQTKISEMEIVLENNKVDNAKEINEINSVLEIKIKLIQERDMAIYYKTSVINQLMGDLKNATDARTRLEKSIEKMKKDMENDNKVAKEKENALTKKVEQLEMAAKEKESELTKQMVIIQDTRKEKERLLSRCLNTIDKFEKAVTTRRAASPAPATAAAAAPAAATAPAAPGSSRHVAEQDNNAVRKKLTPRNKRLDTPPPRKIYKGSGFVAPREPSQRLAKDRAKLLMVDQAGSGERVSSLTYKRRRMPGPSSLNAPLSGVQLKEAKTKRSIFKNKRSDNKSKKPKTDE